MNRVLDPSPQSMSLRTVYIGVPSTYLHLAVDCLVDGKQLLFQTKNLKSDIHMGGLCKKSQSKCTYCCLNVVVTLNH